MSKYNFNNCYIGNKIINNEDVLGDGSMKDLNEFKDWLKRMEQYGTISGSTAETVLEFVEHQQKEIEILING